MVHCLPGSSKSGTDWKNASSSTRGKTLKAEETNLKFFSPCHKPSSHPEKKKNLKALGIHLLDWKKNIMISMKQLKPIKEQKIYNKPTKRRSTKNRK